MHTTKVKFPGVSKSERVIDLRSPITLKDEWVSFLRAGYRLYG